MILPREKLFGRATVSRQNPHPARQGSACPEREAVRLGGCASTGQQRGLYNNAYVSTSNPAVSISVNGIPWKTGGRSHGYLRNASMVGGPSPDVYTQVFGTDARSPMATITHAVVNDRWYWNDVTLRVGAIDEENVVIGGAGFRAFTYLVPRNNDPFGGVVGDPTDNGPAYWIARYFARVVDFRLGKIILEYREPAPQGMVSLSGNPIGQSGFVSQFEKRAEKAFSLGTPGSVGQITNSRPADIRWAFMRDEFLGDCTENQPDFNDD